MSTLLNSWTWTAPSNVFDKVIELYDTHVQVLFGTTKYVEKYSFEDLLLSKNLMAPQIVEFGVRKALSMLPLDLSEMSVEARLAYQFYHYFDNSSLVPDLYKETTANRSLSILLHPYGIEEQYGKTSTRTAHLHSFLLYGPLIGNMPMAKRLAWTDMLLRSLSEEATISHKDCFSIFDYDKIEAQQFHWEDKVNHIERSLYIHKGHASFTEQQYMDGFSVEISIENLWYLPASIDLAFKDKTAEIYENLKNAIIEERRENWYFQQ
jgi:hypothetical protein